MSRYNFEVRSNAYSMHLQLMMHLMHGKWSSCLFHFLLLFILPFYYFSFWVLLFSLSASMHLSPSARKGIIFRIVFFSLFLYPSLMFTFFHCNLKQMKHIFLKNWRFWKEILTKKKSKKVRKQTKTVGEFVTYSERKWRLKDRNGKKCDLI